MSGSRVDPDPATRALGADEAARQLKPGDEHYRAYVGPPQEYDLMGASQFRLLTTLGLRSHHRLLDFGCGSLRAGRLFIPYLDPDRYFGLEPNAWLIEDALARDIGADLVQLRRPVFRHDDDFSVDGFGVAFDYIVAQSVFSHTASDVAAVALASFARTLADDGLILLTMLGPNAAAPLASEASGWIYPGLVSFTWTEVEALASSVGLVARALPWRHRRQTWVALARRPERLPPEAFDAHLSGRVWGEPVYDAPALTF